MAGARVEVGRRVLHSRDDGVTWFDGLPAGEAQLRVFHPDYDALQRTLSLPPGRRDALALELTPTPRFVLTARVTEVASGVPVGGAALELHPLEVLAGQTGLVETRSDWDGGVRIPEVAPGRYRVVVSAPGLETLRRELELRAPADAVGLALALHGLGDLRSLRVEVLDLESRAPLPGATVTLAEAFPVGVHRRGHTDAQGRISWADLQVGAWNREGPGGLLAATRAEVGVVAEAPGHHPAAATLVLGQRDHLQLLLPLLRELDEQEPNDLPDPPQPIVPGDTVRLELARRGDVDTFWFQLGIQGEATFDLDANPSGSTHLRLVDASGQRVQEAVGFGKPIRMVASLRPGRYRLEVSEYGRDAPLPGVMRLAFGVTDLPEAAEPNQTAAEARPLPGNQMVRGYLFPRGDADVYRLDLPRASWVRFVFQPHPLQRHLRLTDLQGAEVFAAGLHPGQHVSQVGLRAGRYLLAVTEWGNDQSSTVPYELEVQVADDDEVPGAARELPLRGLAGGSVLPIRDQDSFELRIPTRGRLEVTPLAPHQLELEVQDLQGTSLARGGFHPGQRGPLVWEPQGPQRARLLVREWGSDAAHHGAYLLRTWFSAQGEPDELFGDPGPEGAAPVEPGETIRETILPLRDQDWYAIPIDHPGVLRVTLRNPTQLRLRYLDARDRELLVVSQHPGTSRHDVLVAPGTVRLHVQEWGNDSWSRQPYELQVALERAHPDERAPASADRPRRLVSGRALAFGLERPDDLDRFLFEVADGAPRHLSVASDRQVWLRLLDDRTGQEVLTRGLHPGSHDVTWTPAGPTRYLLTFEEWGHDSWSIRTGYLKLDAAARPITAARVTVAVDEVDPTRARFQRGELPGATPPARVRVDADGDGGFDLELPPGGAGEFRYPTEGRYLARIHMEGSGGESEDHVWVDAVGPREREGIQLSLLDPAPGAVVREPTPIQARAFTYGRAPLASVQLDLDGRPVGTRYAPPFEFDLPWARLDAGLHRLELVARDTRGRERRVLREFRKAALFDLQPPDGAVLAGDRIRVRWDGGGFGPSRVRVRKQGEDAWRVVEGESGRTRGAWIDGLEAGVPYEFEPEVAGEEATRRVVTRVEGLAFGADRYAATIARDYDQRVGISVRNHLEVPRTLRLEAGAPDPESRLLVGFVGEGSAGAPFELGPGEERQFWLGLSAQDAVRRRVRFPVRLFAGGSLEDEAEVDVAVRLPEVKLEWRDLGPTEDGLGRRLVLHNRGDTLADLELVTSDPDLVLSPAVSHGRLEARGELAVRVHPRLRDGFQRVEGRVVARSLDAEVAHDLALALPEGHSLFRFDLAPPGHPGGDPGGGLSPEAVDWSGREEPEDLDGDGREDRWGFRGPDGTPWKGEDSDGDGEVDFVTADLGGDGFVEFAAFRRPEGFSRTHLVEAWVEVAFRLPWARSRYEPHDVDVVFNGRVVGSLRDTLPEGNYRFRVPPPRLRFEADGSPGDNRVEVQSTHLRGGHYVVTSEFRLKLALTGARVWTAGPSREEARRALLVSPELSLSGPDYAVSSDQVWLSGGSAPGAALRLRARLANLGAPEDAPVPVALRLGRPGAPGHEVARALVRVPPGGSAEASFEVTAPAGISAFAIVVDPDRTRPDRDRDNDRALLTGTFGGGGAATPPLLREPADGAVLLAARVDLAYEAGGAAPELVLDGGLAQDLPASGRARALLQPGAHELRLRAGGAETVARVRVEAPRPELRWLAPAGGVAVDAREVEVRLQVAPQAALVAARVNGGPWIRGPPPGADGTSTWTVPLEFGPCLLEALAVDRQGVRRVLPLEVRCTRPRTPDDPELPATPGEGWIDLADGSRVDAFGPPSGLIVPPPKVRFDYAPGAALLAAVGPAPVLPRARHPSPLGVTVRKQDWYCTNRPQVAVPVPLPAWVRPTWTPVPDPPPVTSEPQAEETTDGSQDLPDPLDESARDCPLGECPERPDLQAFGGAPEATPDAPGQELACLDDAKSTESCEERLQRAMADLESAGIADPVLPATGALVLGELDVEVRAPGGPIRMRRVHHSGRAGHMGFFGAGWRSAYEREVRIEDGALLETDGNGTTRVFPGDGSGGFLPHGARGTTAARVGGELVTTSPTGQLYAYASASARLLRVRDPAGRETRLAYRADGSLESLVDPVGRRFRFEAGTAGRVAALVLPDGQRWRYAYDDLGRLATVTDPLGHEVRYAYDAAGRLAARTDALGGVRRWEYDPEGRVVAFVNEGGGRSSFAYDPAAHETRYTDSLGVTRSFRMDAQGRVVRALDGEGGAWGFEYGPAGGLTARTDPAGRVTRYQLDPRHGRLLSRTAPGGRVTRWVYPPGSAYASAEVRADGSEAKLERDARGLVTRAKNAAGEVTTFTYTPLGLVASETDAAGATTRYEYDPHGNMTKVVDALGGETTATYDVLGRPLDWTDPLGRRTRYEYFLHSLPAAVTDPAGQVRRIEYDALLRPVRFVDVDGTESRREYRSVGGVPLTTRLVDALGQGVVLEFDSEGKQVATTDEAGVRRATLYSPRKKPVVNVDGRGHAYQLRWNPDGSLAGTADALGPTARFSYDEAAELVRVEDALGGAVESGYDALGRLTWVRHPDGSTQAFAYDGMGRLRARRDALGRTRRVGYDPRGLPATLTDAGGATWRTEFDPLGRLVAVTDPNGGVWKQRFDAASQLVAVVDPLGRVTRYHHDVLGRIVEVLGPEGQRTRFSYTRAGLLESETDPNGGVVRHRYDALGRRIETIDQLGHSTHFSYDPVGNLIQLTDPNGNPTRFRYDGEGNLLEVRDALGGAVTYEYDEAGRLVKETDGRGQVHRFEHDPLGRLVRALHPDQVERAAYDSMDQRVESANPTVASTVTYDPLGRPEAVVDSRGFRTRYAYDAAGDLVRIEAGRGEVTEIAYDALGHPVRLVSPRAGTYAFAYDAAGRETRREHPTGEVTTRGYDASGALASIEHRASDGGPLLWSFAYGYDPAGNRIREVEGRADGRQVEVRYGYNPRSELVSASVVTPGGEALRGFREIRYAYDAAGDMVAREVDGRREVFTYDALGRMATVDGVALDWDADGNLLREPVGPGVARTYAYDSRGSLARTALESAQGEAGAVRFFHDADGLEVGAQPEGGDLLQRFAPLGLLTEAASVPAGPATTPGSPVPPGAARTAYLRLGGSVLEEAGPTLVAYLEDGGGSVVERLELERRQGGGATVRARAAARYTPYGELRAGPDDLTFGFQGLLREDLGPDAPDELLATQARHLRPGRGWTSRDPAGFLDGPNRYARLRNNPFAYRDATGLFWERIDAFVDRVLPTAKRVATAVGVAALGVAAGGAAITVAATGGVLAGVAAGAIVLVKAAAVGTVFAIAHQVWVNRMADYLTARSLRNMPCTTPGLQARVHALWARALDKSAVAAGLIGAGVKVGSRAAQALGRGARNALAAFSSRRTSGCFLAGTLVLTQGGPVPIESLRPGDRVLARDAASAEVGPREVLATSTRQVSELQELRVRDPATGTRTRVTGTPEHPVHLSDLGVFMPQGFAFPGLPLSAAEGEAVVEASEARPGPARVFNLEVAGAHSYFVGDGAGGPWVLVHNGGPCGGEGRGGRLRDARGRFVSDPANPPSPYKFTDAQRRAAWRRLAEDPSSPLTPGQRAQIRARGWRGPQRLTKSGELETMELSHEPVPLREGGTEVVPRWPADHAALDPHRHLKGE